MTPSSSTGNDETSYHFHLWPVYAVGFLVRDCLSAARSDLGDDAGRVLAAG